MQITVDVTDVTGRYIFRQHVGEGSYGDVNIDLSTTIPDMSPVIKIDDRTFVVNIHDIVRAVAEAVLAPAESAA